jgi:tight adherence protein C
MGSEIWVVVGGVFVAVLTVVGLVGAVLVDRLSPERRRLERLSTTVGSAGPPQAHVSLSRDAEAAEARQFMRFVPRSPKEMGRLRRQLAKAGYQSYQAVAVYALAELLLPLLFGGIALAVFGFGSGVIIALVAAAAGYTLPSIYLGRTIAAYKKQIRNGLADALDLLIVCVEAGSGLDQAIIKATDELRVSYPALSNEFGLMTTEIRAGKPRLEAFRNLAERTKVDDVQSLVAMLVQTDRFGTSVAQALRTYADVLRTKRRQRAEEKAAKLGVKLVFPLVLCMFPALYVVTLGPAVLEMIRFFSSQGQ